MKKRLRVIGLLLLFIAGLSILLYPTISDRLNRYRDQKLIATYEDTANNISDNTYDSYVEEAKKYNRTLVGVKVPDAFSAYEGVEDPEYERLLNITGDGIMGYVEIPSINVKLSIYHNTTEETLMKGAGHLPGSSLPVGGKTTHCVISAHRGIPSAKMFTDLNLLEKGDIFYLHVLGDTLAYKVDQIQVVQPTDTKPLEIEDGKDYVTLMTCTPYGVNSQRLLVRGVRVPYDAGEVRKVSVTKASPKHNTFNPIRLLCIAIGMGVGILVVISAHCMKRKRGSQKVRV